MQRFVLWTALASVVLCGMMIASLQWGSVELSWRQVLSALGQASAPVTEIVKTIVIDLRLPRVLLPARGWRSSACSYRPRHATNWPIRFCLACLQALPLARCW